MTTFQRTFLLTGLILFILAFGFAGGYIVHDQIPGNRSEFPILEEAYGILQKHGLTDLPDPPRLEYGMIHGMVQAYGDKYTSFVEPAQHELQSDSLQGSFGGVGVSLQKDGEGNWVLFPFPEGPAVEAGIQDGDRLVGVDDLTVTSETPVDQIVAAVRGPVGTQVALKLNRPPDPGTLEFKITRAEIPLPSTTWHVEPTEPRLGVIQINVIASTTPEEIEKAVSELQGQGATHFVLDLRDNGGGLLQTGIKTAQLFLSNAEIIQQQYRGRELESFGASKAGPLVDIPLVVLVNGNTASSAEIIAGALQANKRARLIGSPTYGKDTIQLVFNLQDDSSLYVTAARWWFPNLEFPKDGHGLTPDISVPADAAPEVAIQAAIDAFFENQASSKLN